MRRCLGLLVLSRELLAESVEETDRVGAQPVLEVRQRGTDRPRPSFRLVPGDHEVPDLVEETERPDLSGLDRRRSRLAEEVHPCRKPADACRIGDDEIAAGPDQRPVDRISLARLTTDMERPVVAWLAHRRSIARSSGGHRPNGGAADLRP